MPLLFTPQELELLARRPRQALANIMGAGNWTEAEALWADQRAAYFDFIALCRRWVAALQEHILNTYGREALADASRLDSIIGGLLANGVSLEDLAAGSEATPDAVRAALHDRDVAAVLGAFDSTTQGIRQVHDYQRDWVSALLSWAYRTHGLEGLERALRHCSELLWMPWMLEDITHPPEQRVRDWARLLKANFTTIRILEDDEKFIVIQDPCGSCTRQHSDGRYEGPAALAMVNEPHPLTFMRGEVTAYRTHVAVMHFIMPIERIGAPWPAIECPFTKDEPCRLLLYKNPRRAAPEHYERVGMAPPQA